jgi:hypothetical protein
MVDFRKHMNKGANTMPPKGTTTTRKNNANTHPAAETKKDALVRQTPAALQQANQAAMLEEDEGAGGENVTSKDMAIPRISILQSGSPQVKKSDPKFIKGAVEGDFFDNIANEVAFKGEDGFLMVPVSYRRTNIEWIPKKKGGGFIADHGSDDLILQKCQKDPDPDSNAMLLPNGNEIVTTAEFYCYVMGMDGVSPRQAVVSLAKTQLKKSRKLITQLETYRIPRPSNPKETFNPAYFYSVFHVTSVPESKKDFNWMGWDFLRHSDTLALPEGNELYMAARAFREAVGAGKVKVAAPIEDVNNHVAEPGDDSSL